MSNIPNKFNWKVYLQLNQDLNQDCNEEEAFNHYVNYGIHENRKFIIEIPPDFDWRLYLKLNQDLHQYSNEIDAILHYVNYGISENRQYNDTFYCAKKYIDSPDISVFLSNVNNSSYKNSFIFENNIKKNIPRTIHNSREKISLDLLESFILIIDFDNLGGGTSVFIESIISKYKKNKTFLIARNFNGQIYFTINDDYEVEQNPYNDYYAFYLLLNNKNKIDKIFVNHTGGHSPEFLNNLFTLKKKITTITHDFLLLVNESQIFFNEIDNVISDESNKSKININNFDQIITQNIANLYIYDKFIEDKNKIIITPLPDFKNSKDLINTSNQNIVVGIIGGISEPKGSKELEKIVNYYKNTNIEIVVFGSTNIDSITNTYPYSNIYELNELLLKHNPNMLIEISIWPETYSYTLTISMLTQLPILYLRKNKLSVVEERLNTYNKAFSFTNLSQLNTLLNNKKQDYFYTIDPVIYFNDFWDNYFSENTTLDNTTLDNTTLDNTTLDNTTLDNTTLDNTTLENTTLENTTLENTTLDEIKLEITDSYINKNIVFVTSKIVVSEKPFTYISTRSIYTKEQRFVQTINTMKSIRKHIPDSYIVLVDNSEFNKNEYEMLLSLTDYFINITDDNILNYYTNETPLKILSEIVQQLCFYENFIKKININNTINFFKISGRYFINESFNYNYYNNELNIFKQNKEITDRDYFYTSFYKLNKNILLDYFEELVKIFEEKDNYNENTINDIEVVVPSKIQDKTLVENLGITQIFAVWDLINQI